MINNYLETQIKENFPYEPTFEQEIVLKSLAAFLLSPRNDAVFVLRGYAGTGKTSLVGALVRTLDKLQQMHFLSGRKFLFNEPLYSVDVAVVNVRVRNDVDKLSRLESCGFREHYEQRRILADVPVVRGEHVLAALVEYRVEPVPGDVERHGIGAGSQPHFAEICVIVGVGHYTAAVLPVHDWKLNPPLRLWSARRTASCIRPSALCLCT